MKVKVRKSDCPICNGGGYIHPPPTYRSMRCGHMVDKTFLENRIKSADGKIRVLRERIDEISKEVLRYEGLLMKYFGEDNDTGTD